MSAPPVTIIKQGSLVTPGGPRGSRGSAGFDSQEIGSIKAWPSVTAPPSWDICDGGELPRLTYPELFGLVGTTFGAGNGVDTFNKPDLRGRSILSIGLGAGLTIERTLAEIGGEETHVLTVAELAAHSHTVIDPTHGHTVTDPTHGHVYNDPTHQHPTYDPTHAHSQQAQYYTMANGQNDYGYWNYYANGFWGTTQAAGTGVVANWTGTRCTISAGGTGVSIVANGTGISIANSGGGGAHNNMSPYLVLVYIIKVSGGGGSTLQAPIADTTQDGLLRKVSGKSTDYVDGTNNCKDLIGVIDAEIAKIPAIQPDPIADATKDGWLRKVSGKATDFVDGTNNCQDLPSAIRASIVTVRSYNAIGNPTFEVDQRTAGTGVTNTGFAQDRWQLFDTSSVMTGTAEQMAENVLVPETNYVVTSQFLRITLTAQEAALAAGSSIGLSQVIEGQRLRRLIGDNHSVSLLVRCSSPLNFGVGVRDATYVKSLCKLATIAAPNVWTVVQLPNLPVWPDASLFPVGPGVQGYNLLITLAAGANILPSANDLWLDGNRYGAVGQDNFGALPINTTFDIAFIQHEPGPTCSQFIDVPFDNNLDICGRYFQKTYLYGVKPGTVNQQNSMKGYWTDAANVTFFPNHVFHKPMAKIPTVTIYHPWLGTPNAYSYNGSATAATGVTQVIYITELGFTGFQSGGAPGAGIPCYWHYTADTGW